MTIDWKLPTLSLFLGFDRISPFMFDAYFELVG